MRPSLRINGFMTKEIAQPTDGLIEEVFEDIPLDNRPIRFDRMLARSPLMKKVFRKIVAAAKSDVPVLILGETGTGKELVARAIHNRSPRRKGPFIAINAGALSRDLIASELFGHERGAFTGAADRRKGKFELADGGTIFLDEITTIDEATQAAFLRVLETQEFYRVGGGTPVKVDVRIVAATNSDIGRLIEEGRFRADLFYRLDVFPITLPPLRERPGAVRYLCQEFLKTFRETCDLPVFGFMPEAMHAIERYAWPGNVRELKNVIQRAVLLARRGLVGIGHLPERIVDLTLESEVFEFPLGRPLREVEGEYVRRTLACEGGNKTRAARSLRISRKALYQKLRRA